MVFSSGADSFPAGPQAGPGSRVLPKFSGLARPPIYECGDRLSRAKAGVHANASVFLDDQRLCPVICGQLARRGLTAAPERPNRTLLGKGATAARLTRLTSGRRRSLRGLYNKILSLLEGSNKPYRWRQAAYTLRLLRVRTKGEGRTFASAPSVASAGVGLLCARLIAARPIAAGSSDETDAADAIFGPRAHPNHPASGATLTRERDFDAESAEKRLRPS